MSGAPCDCITCVPEPEPVAKMEPSSVKVRLVTGTGAEVVVEATGTLTEVTDEALRALDAVRSPGRLSVGFHTPPTAR